MMGKNFMPPGYRFHPTDVELVCYFLKRKIMGKPSRYKDIIAEVELYKFCPWDLPEKSCLRSKDLVWYFFCLRNNKYTCGSRTNRATDIGYWKPTGQDRTIVHKSQIVGMAKTLVFHIGKSPKGTRTNWVMYEFRLESDELANAGYKQDSYVLCKIFEKSGQGPKTGEQYGAPFNEKDWESDEDDAEKNNDDSLPIVSHAPVDLLYNPVPLQSIVPEASGPYLMPHNFEVGMSSSFPEHSRTEMRTSIQVPPEEPSDVPEPSRIRELSSMQNSEVEAPSNVPGPYYDSILSEQPESSFHNSLSCRANADPGPESQRPAIPPENAIQELGFADFEPFLSQPFWEPNDGMSLSECFDEPILSQPFWEPNDGMSFFDLMEPDNHEPRPSWAAEYADEHYMDLLDLCKANEELLVPHAQHLPNTNFGN